MIAEISGDCAVHADGEGLQWGRDLMIAEISGSIVASALSPELQWGRDLMIAENPALTKDTHRVMTASRGPRSHDRGNSPRRRRFSQTPAGFNGAAIS